MTKLNTTNQMVREFERVLSEKPAEKPAVEIISQSKTQVGPVAVTFTVGRINPTKR